MTVLGAVLAAASVTAAVLAIRPRSVIGLRLARIAPRGHAPKLARSLLITRELAQSGLGWSEIDLVRAKLVAGLAAAALAAVLSLIVPFGPIVVVAAAYVGFVLPTVRVDRAAAHRRSEAERGLVMLVEWAEALVASGRPVETAFVAIAEKSTGGRLIDDAVAAAVRSYALGAPLFRVAGTSSRRRRSERCPGSRDPPRT